MPTEPVANKGETSAPWVLRPLLLQAVPVAVYLLSAACCVWYGDLNADEGWVLNAARQAMQGLVPHRDFAYTQGPLQPYLYGLLLWPVGHGIVAAIAGNRAVTHLRAARGILPGVQRRKRQPDALPPSPGCGRAL